MRRLIILLLISAGCAQLRNSGRFQEVLINSKPVGASVFIEGVSPLSTVTAFKNGKQVLLYSSQVTLTTPVKLVLDKERTYTIHISFEGKTKTMVLKPRFAFHPYLIILFPIVPFVVDYDVKCFDNVNIDFTEGFNDGQGKELSGDSKDAHGNSPKGAVLKGTKEPSDSKVKSEAEPEEGK